MVEIDGAHGEGGGQLVRTAVALSAVTGTAIRVTNVRAGRRNPGLAPQHVAALRAVASMCDAHCEGVVPRSTTITFAPGRLRGGAFRVDVGTAGSVTLVLQAMLPALLAAREPSEVTIRGGTDVRAAPPIDYLRFVLLPLMEKMGVHARLCVLRRGYFPKGGGEVRLQIGPTAHLDPFVVEQRGPVETVEIHAHVAHLAPDILQRMTEAARRQLPPALPVRELVETCAPQTSLGPGGAIVLCARAGPTLLGAAQIAQRGIRAEELGLAAAQSLARDLEAGATLDVHAADQMLAILALAGGPSAFRATEVTSHARTAMWLLEQLDVARFSVVPAASGVRVRVEPRCARAKADRSAQ